MEIRMCLFEAGIHFVNIIDVCIAVDQLQLPVQPVLWNRIGWDTLFIVLQHFQPQTDIQGRQS
ncbi:hypothetical protein LI224_17290, partial [Erysipelatoclostridium ramosum]|uniref:hypothetical protein n=1 Tax=Thomasclavelia ramosa TaxID=1547 RepID=UPI001D05F341